MVACTRRIAPASCGTKATSLGTARVERAAWCMPSPHARDLGISHLMNIAEDVLFLAGSAGASCYHRTMLPAAALGCDWGGLDAPPPELILGRGEVRFDEGKPDLGAYRIVVLQTPTHEGWLDVIPQLQAGGTRVLFDADYHMHEIATDEDVLNLIEALLQACDGVICATPYIAERYARFNARTFVCENGIDLRGYELTRPPHDTVN